MNEKRIAAELVKELVGGERGRKVRAAIMMAKDFEGNNFVGRLTGEESGGGIVVTAEYSPRSGVSVDEIEREAEGHWIRLFGGIKGLCDKLGWDHEMESFEEEPRMFVGEVTVAPIASAMDFGEGIEKLLRGIP